MTTGADVVTAARTHLGTTWMHQARLPGVALDCAGLVIVVARSLGLVAADFDVNGYDRAPDGTMLSWCDQYMTLLATTEPGAVLVLQKSDLSEPQHLGIVGDYRHGGDSIIHACSHAGTVIETRLMFARNMVLRGIYRMPGVV